MSFTSKLIKIFILFLFFEIASHFITLEQIDESSFYVFNKFLLYLEIIKNLLFHFFRYSLPNVLFLIMSYNFFLCIRKKILQLKEIKLQMSKQARNVDLEYYRNNMLIMKSTLLWIIGYLFFFGVISLFLFSESLFMENILFFNIALVLTTLLEVNTQENPNRLTKNANFFINFTMIFLSSFLINDLVYWLTGVKAYI